MQHQTELTSVVASAPPPHVPREAIFDFDYVHAPLAEIAPQFGLSKKIEEAGPIFWSPYNGGHWVVKSAGLGVEMLRDTELFSSHPTHNATRQFETTLLPVQADPPAHGEYRKVLGSFFAPGNMRRIAPQIRAIATELIDEIQPRGRCEFVSEFGEIFPIAVFLRLVDAPMSDRKELLGHVALFARATGSEMRSHATEHLGNYVMRLFEQRRAKPGDDILSRLLATDFGGTRPLNDAELRGLGTLLLLGGLDTVKSVMSFMMLWLARNQESYRRLIDDPGLIPGATEEMMRVSGMSNPERGVTRDVTYAGMPMKAGERVVFLLPLMSFDPSLNACPHAVDFKRELSSHLIFGAGVHRCAGSHLARIEITILLEEWTRRFPGFRLDPERTPAMEAGVLWTPKTVPLVWP